MMMSKACFHSDSIQAQQLNSCRRLASQPLMYSVTS